MPSVDDVKQWLNSYRDISNDIEKLELRAEFIQDKTAPHSPILDGMPHGSGSINDRIAENVAILQDIKQQISELYQILTLKRKCITKYVNMLSSTGRGYADKKCVILTRYIDLMKWEDVTDLMFCNKEDFLGKEDTYLRRVHKIHKKALEDLTLIVPENEIQEMGAEIKRQEMSTEREVQEND